MRLRIEFQALPAGERCIYVAFKTKVASKAPTSIYIKETIIAMDDD